MLKFVGLASVCVFSSATCVLYESRSFTPCNGNDFEKKLTELILLFIAF